MSNFDRQRPPPYTPYSEPPRPGILRPPTQPNLHHYVPTENTPLIGEIQHIRRRTNQAKQGSATKQTSLILLLPLVLILLATSIVTTILNVDYKTKLDDALNPENIRLRNEMWAKEQQDHEHVKLSWAKEELRLRDDYKRSEIEWAGKEDTLRKEYEQIRASWTKEEIRLRDDYKRSEIEWAQKKEILRKEHEKVKDYWAKEEIRLRENYKRSEIEWTNKKEVLRKEHDRLKDIWAKENERYCRDQIQWEDERKAEENRRRENERRRLGITWGPPFAHKCAAYGTRPYNAKLMNVPSGFNSIEACGEMPIVFHDRTIEKPSWCEKLGNGEVYGHWMIDFDEPLCQPYWANPEDKGCVGYKSGLRRWEARLLDLNMGDSWPDMCATTSNTINGHHFKTPSHCEDRGFWSGMVGLFDAPDSSCN